MLCRPFLCRKGFFMTKDARFTYVVLIVFSKHTVMSNMNYFKLIVFALVLFT